MFWHKIKTMFRHNGKILQIKAAPRAWLQSGWFLPELLYAVKLWFQWEYKGKAGVKSGTGLHPSFAWWPHQSRLIDLSHVVPVGLDEKWSSRGVLFWYHIRLFLRESYKGRAGMLLPANPGCSQGAGWNSSGFPLKVPVESCGSLAARGTHQAAPETPRFPFCTEIQEQEVHLRASLGDLCGFWPLTGGVMGFLFGYRVAPPAAKQRSLFLKGFCSKKITKTWPNLKHGGTQCPLFFQPSVFSFFPCGQ